MLRLAAASPASLVLGLDADARAMADASRRAVRPVRKGGLANALFVPSAAEAVPGELCGRTDEVTVLFPWGSLLRGVLGLPGGEAAACGLASLVRAGGRAVAFVSVVPGDRLDGLSTLDTQALEQAARAHGANGLVPVGGRPATQEELRETGESWARRLGAAQAAGRGAGEAAARRGAANSRSGSARWRGRTPRRRDRTLRLAPPPGAATPRRCDRRCE